MRQQLRQFRKFRIAGTQGCCAFAFEAGEPVEHMHGIIGAALFAVIDDVDAAFDLLLRDMVYRFTHCGGKLRLARAGLLQFSEQQFDHLGGARQTAGVGGENPIGAAFHNRPCCHAGILAARLV